MSQKKKRNFNLGKNKLVSWLRGGLRILFLIIFFHWILWFTTYAKCTNYYEAINDEKIDRHDKKTEKYNNNGLLRDEHKEKDIAEIEEDILKQIEQKKGLKEGELLRKWQKEELPELKKLHEEIEKLEKKESPTKEEREELAEKRKDYQTKLKKAKEKTIGNKEEKKGIQGLLKENKLDITELDDNRNWHQSITHDPLKFFIVSPLNKASKALGLHNMLFLEIIFKLVIIEIISVLVYYSETIKVWENMEKIRNPYLSVEEKEKLNEEASSLAKYLFFNGFMMVLFNIFLSFHPAFFDRTNPLFRAGEPGTEWYIWIFPIFASFLLSSISSEFLRHGRLLSKSELIKCLVKSWVVSLVGALIVMLLIIWLAKMNSVGTYLLISLGGLVKLLINTIRAKFFGHREYLPGGAN